MRFVYLHRRVNIKITSIYYGREYQKFCFRLATLLVNAGPNFVCSFLPIPKFSPLPHNRADRLELWVAGRIGSTSSNVDARHEVNYQSNFEREKGIGILAEDHIRLYTVVINAVQLLTEVAPPSTLPTFHDNEPSSDLIFLQDLPSPMHLLQPAACILSHS